MAKLVICGKSNIGKEREHNEDTFLMGCIVDNKDEVYLELPLESSYIKKYGFLAAIADGIGGHSAGEVASGLTLDLLSRQFMLFPKGAFSKEEIKIALKDSILSIHNTILETAKTNPVYSDMGTTLVGVYFTSNGFYVYHVGDSRLYRLRNNGLKQLTKDHSLIQSLIESGQIAVEESHNHPQKNVIINSLGGGNTKCEPEVIDSYTAFESDIFLLCSDGLSDMVNEDRIEKILNNERPIRARVSELINTANENGGKDNITVVLIEVIGKEEQYD